MFGGDIAATSRRWWAATPSATWSTCPTSLTDPVAAAAETPTFTARPTLTPLPRQYAFSHFVRETANCYQRNGQEATPAEVEADIMHDVPLAAERLMRLYADNLCEEQESWRQMSGIGWMLGAPDVPLPKPSQ